MKRTYTITLGIMILSAAGCSVGPNYSRPATPAATGWKEQNTNAPTAKLAAKWWEIFGDAELNSLEGKAIDANQDLKRAVARVTEARAVTSATKADRYPQITAGGGYTRSRVSENTAYAPPSKFDSDNYNGSIDLNYEVDVWGRV